MSATGRNVEGHERPAGDFFRTPAWATLAMWRRLYGRGVPSSAILIDAGSGDGAISSVLASMIAESVSRRRATLMLIERDLVLMERAAARPELQHAVHVRGDFLTMASDRRDRIVIMNPPYEAAQEFVEHAIRNATTVVALLRLGFLESDKRAEFHRQFPSHVFVMPSRPSFAYGKTDSSAYGWFAWNHPSFDPGHWEILDVGDRNWRKANP